MTRTTAKSLKINRLSGVHRLVVFIAALGILLQSYVTQTHIHSGAPDIGGIFQIAGHASAPEKAPLNKVTACPLCQAIVHAGAFVAPSAPLVYLTFSWVRTGRFVFAAPVTSGDVSHAWRSRAPPRA